MPGRASRREHDSRGGRFESEIRTSDMQKMSADRMPRIYMCSSCHKVYEEKSRHCPRCDTRTMGELRQHAAGNRGKYLEQSLARARARVAGGG